MDQSPEIVEEGPVLELTQGSNETMEPDSPVVAGTFLPIV